jgi:hypothetical protein
VLAYAFICELKFFNFQNSVKMKQMLFLLLLAACQNVLIAQSNVVVPTIIKIENKSFEDEPNTASTPEGWNNCGFNGETPPDIHEYNPRGSYFGVKHKPLHGRTYLGLVARDNKTWESIDQRLPSPLLKDSAYKFSIHLSQSYIYLSQSRISSREASFTTPAILRVWGSNADCGRTELLAMTDPVDHNKWHEYELLLKPKNGSYQTLVLEVYYAGQGETIVNPTNGHILLDKMSDIVLVRQ